MKDKVIALGFFDGVHLGHGALLRRAAEEAKTRGCLSAVLTFARPPKEVVTGTPVPLINTPEDREWLIKRLYGIDKVIFVPFDHDMMTCPWEKYITDLLVKKQHAVHLVAGHDHHFGYKNQGSPELLVQKCRELGLGCDIIPKVERGGITVSSTYIRQLVKLGQIERATRYLGHPHILSQAVRHGHQIGHAFLVPTINMTAPPHVLVPSYGVYVSRAYLSDGSSYIGVTNIGTRPTVNEGTDVTVETHLLDFSGNLYEQMVRVAFFKRLRDEVRFDSRDSLKAQILKDADSARAYFSEHPNNEHWVQ